MERYALAFRVRPGAEPAVASLIGGYDPPPTATEDSAGPLATAAFMRGNLVVASVEIDGDLRTAARALVSKPEFLRIEALLQPALEQAYDITDPADRASFARAHLMERLMHVESEFDVGDTGRPQRFALRYPVKPGAARAVAQVFIDAGQLPMRIGNTLVHSTSLFVLGDDTLVRIMTIEGDNDEVVAALSKSPAIHAMAEKLADKWSGDYDFHSVDGMGAFFRDHVLETVLERENTFATSDTSAREVSIS